MSLSGPRRARGRSLPAAEAEPAAESGFWLRYDPSGFFRRSGGNPRSQDPYVRPPEAPPYAVNSGPPSPRGGPYSPRLFTLRNHSFAERDTSSRRPARHPSARPLSWRTYTCRPPPPVEGAVEAHLESLPPPCPPSGITPTSEVKCGALGLPCPGRRRSRSRAANTHNDGGARGRRARGGGAGGPGGAAGAADFGGAARGGAVGRRGGLFGGAAGRCRAGGGVGGDERGGLREGAGEGRPAEGVHPGARRALPSPRRPDGRRGRCRPAPTLPPRARPAPNSPRALSLCR